jgi:MerR family transcriptional regulator, light-induced transcriptional regulator
MLEHCLTLNPMTSAAVEADRTRHPIAVVAERTGLSQDVLRVWERRHRVVDPGRGSGGQRLYSDADIARLRLLHAATRAGRGIGQVAGLTTAALSALVEEDAAASAEAPRRDPWSAHAVDHAGRVIEASLRFIRSLDRPSLDETLRRAVARVGVAKFLGSIAAPLLRRVGDEWHAGRLSPAQEHLASSVVHHIAADMLRTSPSHPAAPRVLVATPAGDMHAVGAALVAAAAAVEGWNVLYLGADLPAPAIAEAARAADTRLVALSVVYLDDRDRVLGELRSLRESLPTSVVLLAGGSGAAAIAPELRALGVRVGSSLAGLTAELHRAQAIA